MGFRLALSRRAAWVAVVLALGWVLSGCGGPKPEATQFLGKWRLSNAPANEITLNLRSDGTGESTVRFYPHQEEVRWVLVSDKLVLSAMDGTGTTEYKYRFDGPDKLVFPVNGKESTLVRVK